MEIGKLLDSLVAELSEVGLLLNADKTVLLTTQSQPTAFDNHNCSWNHTEGSVRQRRKKIGGLHVKCVRIGA